jgi:hypothetical protein
VRHVAAAPATVGVLVAGIVTRAAAQTDVEASAFRHWQYASATGSACRHPVPQPASMQTHESTILMTMDLVGSMQAAVRFIWLP